MNKKKRNAIICGVLSAILMIIITLISTNMFKEVKIKKSDFIKATKECPYSYEDKDGKCTKTTISEVGYECKTGTLAGNTCITFDTKALVKSCPRGSRLINNKCLYEQNSICPTGEKDINNECHNTEEANLTCESGKTLHKKKCYPLHILAPSSQELTDHPEDYEAVDAANNKYIKKNEATNPNHTCPTAGFTYNTTLNLCTKKSNNPKVCTAGFKLENNKCTKYVDVQLSCPQGYDRNDNTCERKSRIKAEKIKDENNKCPKNYEFKDNQCIKTQTKEYIYSCPNGFKLKEDKCYKM
mgnify:FL=1